SSCIAESVVAAVPLAISKGAAGTAATTDAALGPTAIALPILRAGVRTTAVCLRSAPALSCPRPPPLMSRAGIWSRLSARTLDKPPHFPAGRKPRAAIAPQQQRFRWRICKRRTHDRNAGCGGIRDQARDRGRNFQQNTLRA